MPTAADNRLAEIIAALPEDERIKALAAIEAVEAKMAAEVAEIRRPRTEAEKRANSRLKARLRREKRHY